MPRNLKPIEYYVNERGCYICISHSCDSNGYPQKQWVRDGHLFNSTIVKYLWEQTNGIISNGVEIRHNCDERACINLEHIQLGTRADNVADRVARGRSYSRLIVDQVRFIRANRFPDGQQLSGAELAEMFSVSQTVISHVVNRKYWKHVR